MNILSTSTSYLYIPVTGPDGVDLTVFPVSVALRLEALGGEPATGDYVTATWSSGAAKVLITAGAQPDGEYLAYVRIVASPEDIRLLSGRVRIGDTRT
jgi:hypothetical protein